MKPSTPGARVAVAEAQAAVARARLGQTVEVLKQRISPRSLAHDLTDTLKDRGRLVARAGQQRPEVVAGAIAGVALFLARHRIVRLVRRVTGTSPKVSTPQPRSRKGSVK